MNFLPGTASLVEQLDSEFVVSLDTGCVSASPCFPCDVMNWPSMRAPDPVPDHLIIPAERVLVVLRDGRNLVGFLRSFDQFCKCTFLVDCASLLRAVVACLNVSVR